MIKTINKKGALPDFMISEMLASGFITGGSPDNVNPSSLDLAITDEIYQVKTIFQPLPGESVRSLLRKIPHTKHSLKRPLLKDKIYLAKLNETISLPKSVYGYCNPKSSTGRTDIHVRVITDGVSRYDTVPDGIKRAELWIIINPKSYSVLIPTNQPLSQLRLFNQDSRFNELELEIAFSRYRLLWDRRGREIKYRDLKIKDGDGSVILTLDLDSPILGYQGRLNVGEVLDFSRRREYNHSKFFRTIKPSVAGLLELKKDNFYLLSTNEAVRVPENLACEMVPMDERSGEFRSHYAGFIDPGWGLGADNQGWGRPLTLEVRPFEDLVIRKGQPIAKIRFEQVAGLPDCHYDKFEKSNYTGQFRVGLPKQFKQ